MADFESLGAVIQRLETQAATNREKVDANLKGMKAEMMAQPGSLASQMGVFEETLDKMDATVKAGQENVKAFLERKERIPGEKANIVAPHEDSNGATLEETIGVTEERSKVRRLAARRRGRPKKRTQDDGGSRRS
jgi:uncharacterized protein (UPF0335 family)